MKTFTRQCVIGIMLIQLVECNNDKNSTVVTVVATVIFLIVVLFIIVIIVILVIKRRKNNIPGHVFSRGGNSTVVPAGMIAVPPGSILVNNPNQLYPPSATTGWGQEFGQNFVPSVAYVGQFQVHHPPPSMVTTKTSPEAIKQTIETITIKERSPAEDELALLECVDLTSIAGSDYKLESDYKPPKSLLPSMENTNDIAKVNKQDSLDIISVNSEHSSDIKRN